MANDTTIAPQNDSMFDTGRVDNMSQSPVVELTADQEFDSANVTMEYDDTGLENESQEVAIFTYDPEAGIFVPLNSTVDPANDTVTAQTEHFSTFAVYNIENWASTYDAKEPVRETGDDGVTPVDVVMLMDVSGSMKSQDPDRLAKDAAQQFTSGLLDRDRAAVVSFANSGHVEQPLTSDFTAVNQSIRNLKYEGGNGGTDFASIGAANEHFMERSSPDRGKIMIFLTDGRSLYADGTEKAAEAAENNVTIYAIGFGGASRSQLDPIAERTGGNVSLVDSAADLPEVFSRVAENTTTINDTDGDGLSDEREVSGIVLGGPDGEVVRTDPTSNDTDGDGLSDSREVGEFRTVSFTSNGQEYEGSYFDYTANPTTPDTDFDGVDDGKEVHTLETDPRDRETDNDGLIDYVDPDPRTQNLPPEFGYSSWDTPQKPPLVPNPTTLLKHTTDAISVNARSESPNSTIETIRIRQRVDPDVPFTGTVTGWNNRTYNVTSQNGSDEPVTVTTTYGDVVGQIAPDYVKVEVIDSNGNYAAYGENTTEYSRYLATGSSGAKSALPAVAVGGTAGGTAATSTGTGIASGVGLGAVGTAAAGVVVVGGVAGGTVVIIETSGSAGAVQQNFERTTPYSETVQQWELSELSSQYDSSGLPEGLALRAGATTPGGGYGAEHVYETSPLETPGDVEYVLSNVAATSTSVRHRHRCEPERRWPHRTVHTGLDDRQCHQRRDN
ncbi:VWA domain-containing protein (plasmid) [Halomicrobium sp. IBSBa]|nr:VWA domain-containing protein [Halomicrobium sp. IBSBa]